ncbi:hypothetical protein ACQPXM_02355 [Kribbella sp. CA-253562]|uniref:hypothetical protein n=1 Tax=Kribbella sp. CA-253562 TaxID=3239942 RepID=UPI003D8F1303
MDLTAMLGSASLRRHEAGRGERLGVLTVPDPHPSSGGETLPDLLGRVSAPESLPSAEDTSLRCGYDGQSRIHPPSIGELVPFALCLPFALWTTLVTLRRLTVELGGSTGECGHRTNMPMG